MRDGVEREFYVEILSGIVALWGRVFEHERGFRSTRAYPMVLWGPDPIVSITAANYGVQHLVVDS